MVLLSYAAGLDGVWWEWLVALTPLVVLVRMAKSHLERPRR